VPILPSGLNLGIARNALFDHGGNWFSCPDGHFWYWVPDPDFPGPPFDIGDEIVQIAEHAPVPKTREETKTFIQVIEVLNEDKVGWRGEWLATFPEFTEIDDADWEAWTQWINRPETDGFLDDTISECRRLAEVSRKALGHAVLHDVGPMEPDGWPGGNLKIPKN